MKTLRTIFPYSLNERTRKYDSEVPVVKLFFSTPRTDQRSSRYRNNKDFLKNNTITELLTNINNIMQNEIKDPFYKIRIILNNLKKILKQTSPELLQNGNMLDIKTNNHFYNYVLDIIDTKIYKFKQTNPKKTHKCICIVKFDNKASEAIRLPKSFNHPHIIKTISCNLQKKDSIPTVSYKLGNTIRNKI